MRYLDLVGTSRHSKLNHSLIITSANSLGALS
jgi:hypothetical protein